MSENLALDFWKNMLTLNKFIGYAVLPNFLHFD